jgi:hypothetical protein
MAWNTSTVQIGHSTQKSDYDRLRQNDQSLASSDFTFNGAKTFNSSTVFNITSKFNGGVTGTCTFRGNTTFKAKITFTATSIFNNRVKVNNRSDFSGSFNIVGTATVTGKVIQSQGYLHGSIHGSAVSQNTIFDTLAPFIPNTNDSCLISARSAGTTTGYKTTYSKAIRTGASTIDLYGVDDNLSMIVWTITDGSATTVAQISIAW